jgi:hypothetical protein
MPTVRNFERNIDLTFQVFDRQRRYTAWGMGSGNRTSTLGPTTLIYLSYSISPPDLNEMISMTS